MHPLTNQIRNRYWGREQIILHGDACLQFTIYNLLGVALDGGVYLPGRKGPHESGGLHTICIVYGIWHFVDLDQAHQTQKDNPN